MKLVKLELEADLNQVLLAMLLYASIDCLYYYRWRCDIIYNGVRAAAPKTSTYILFRILVFYCSVVGIYYLFFNISRRFAQPIISALVRILLRTTGRTGFHNSRFSRFIFKTQVPKTLPLVVLLTFFSMVAWKHVLRIDSTKNISQTVETYKQLYQSFSLFIYDWFYKK